MKAKKHELFLTVAFCGFLCLMLLLFLLAPKESYSQREKRYLTEFPTLTWDSLASGQFSQDLESYMADHMPGRDFFVGLNAYTNLLTGRQAAADIYVTADGRLVEAPTAWDEAAAQKNMDAIHQFAASVDGEISLMVVPSAGFWAADTIAHAAASYQDDVILRKLYTIAGPTIQTIDLLTLYQTQAAPECLYYRTDHHWTSRGAYLAYTAYCEDAKSQSHFRIETVSGFQGSTYSRSALWLTAPESLELWHGSHKITVSNAETAERHDGPFYVNRLEETDKYTVFLDGNHSLVRLHNPAGSGKLLVVRDSYGSCLGPFLAESYEEVILVDLRYYKQPVSQLLAAEDIQDVLICYSLNNFMTDANILWLR